MNKKRHNRTLASKGIYLYDGKEERMSKVHNGIFWGQFFWRA